MIAAVQAALDALQLELALVRLEEPCLTPRQQEQLAKARCVEEITAANMAIDRRERVPSLRPPGHGTRAAYK
jgi:hypothetical protein